MIYRNGEVPARVRLERDGGVCAFTDTPQVVAYYRAELRGRPEVGLLQRLIYGRTLALTNPIYVRYSD